MEHEPVKVFCAVLVGFNMASAESIPNGLFCVYWSFCNIAAR
jgi:hypothetical protein